MDLIECLELALVQLSKCSYYNRTLVVENAQSAFINYHLEMDKEMDVLQINFLSSAEATIYISAEKFWIFEHGYRGLDFSDLCSEDSLFQLKLVENNSYVLKYNFNDFKRIHKLRYDICEVWSMQGNYQ